MLLGVIADDFSGATDIAGFLVSNGISTEQVIGVPDEDLVVGSSAVVISLKSRSCPVHQAVSDSVAALNWLRRRKCRQFFQKYCSTFDSTSEGNIGPVADALLDELGESFTVICPALPVNGRTIYNGHLFVNGVLLEETGLRYHPINPMTDSHLVRLMESQARGTCGVVRLDTVARGESSVRRAIAALRDSGKRYAVLDAIRTSHLKILGRAVSDMPLVTGGSGLADGMAKTWNPDLKNLDHAAEAGRPVSGDAVILSGSCSEMSQAQVSAYQANAPAYALEPAQCLSNPAYAQEMTEWVAANRGVPVPMVYATTDSERLALIKKQFGNQAGSAIEKTFGAIAKMLADAGFRRFIVAGGETSGAVVQALSVSAMHIGPQIALGVPWVRAVNKPYSLVLKSGNFGRELYFSKCQNKVWR